MRFFYFIVLAFVTALPAHAQTRAPTEAELYDESHIGNPHYKNMVRKISQMRGPDFDSNFNFELFRYRYSQSSWYDPDGEQSHDQLYRAVYELNTADTPEKEGPAFANYHALLQQQFGNIDALFIARSFAKDDARFGDVALLNWLIKGIQNNILNSGDGTSLRYAYDVITLAEETALLRMLNVLPMSTKTRTQGVVHYSIHAMVDPVTGQKRDVFVDISVPMKKIIRDEKSAPGPSINITK